MATLLKCLLVFIIVSVPPQTMTAPGIVAHTQTITPPSIVEHTTPRANTWARTFTLSGQHPTLLSVSATSDGGYLATGYVYPDDGLPSAWVVRLDASGTILWQKTYGGDSGYLAEFGAQQTFDGGFVLAGETFGAGGEDAWVMKADARGNVMWQRSYGGPGYDAAFAVRQTTDGGFAVAGATESFGQGGLDMWVLRLDPRGDVLWQKAYGGPSNDGAEWISQNSDGGFIVAGYTQSFGVNMGAWVLRLDSLGNVLWGKIFGYAQDIALSAEQTHDGGFVVAGSTGSFGAGVTDAWVARLDPQGNVVWQKAYGGGGQDSGFAIFQTRDGGFVLSGEATPTFSSGPNSNNNHLPVAWILRLDREGNIEWQESFGGSGWDAGRSDQPALEGGIVVAGWTTKSSSRSDSSFILKLNSKGGLAACPSSSIQNIITSRSTLAATSFGTAVDTHASSLNTTATAHSIQTATAGQCPFAGS